MLFKKEKMYLDLLKDGSTALNEGHKYVGSLVKDVSEVLREFSNSSKISRKNEIKLVQHLEQSYKYIDHLHADITGLMSALNKSRKKLKLRRLETNDLKKQLAKSKKEAEDYKRKYEQQKKQTEDYKKTVTELQQKCDASKELNRIYSASMGSVLATLLWKTSKSEEAIDTYIKTGTMNQFLHLANNTILSFFETYVPERLPETESYEFKYITSLFGVCINISAQKAGRQYLLERDIGENLIQNVIHYIKVTPMPIGTTIKRLAIMLLYNLTFTKQGTILIQTNSKIIDNIMLCFDDRHTPEIKIIALTLLNVLLNNPPAGFRQKIKQKLSQIEDNFKTVMDEADDKTESLLKEFFQKLRMGESP